MLLFYKNKSMLSMLRTLNQLLKWRSFPSKTSFQRHRVGTTTGYFLLFQLQTSHVLSHAFEPLSPGFLILPTKSYIVCPCNTLALFLLILFPISFHFSGFYVTTSSFPTSTSDFPAFYHPPLISDYHMLWSARKPSYFSFFLYISPIVISSLLLNTTSSHI